jgi:uracil-DNA glycosylase
MGNVPIIPGGSRAARRRRSIRMPAASEIRACRPWQERELASVKPGSDDGRHPAHSGFGKITPINKNVSRLGEFDDGIKTPVTVDPSRLLRLPDAEAKTRKYQRFADDLTIATALLKKPARAA